MKGMPQLILSTYLFVAVSQAGLRYAMGIKMEKVINLLYDIEEKANQIVIRANEEKVSLYKKLERDLAQLDQEIADENSAKLEILKTQADKELTLEKQSLIDDCNKQLSNMETYYKKNHDSLVDKIMQEIIQS